MKRTYALNGRLVEIQTFKRARGVWTAKSEGLEIAREGRTEKMALERCELAVAEALKTYQSFNRHGKLITMTVPTK